MTKKTYRRTVLKLWALWIERTEMYNDSRERIALDVYFVSETAKKYRHLTSEIFNLSHVLYHADPEFNYATPRMFQMFVVINRSLQFVAYEEFGSEIKIK